MIKYLDISEFREFGLLQEINRTFFHPRGLALEVTLDDVGNYSISGIQDLREDPEGMTFANSPSRSKYESCQKLLDDKATTRKHTLGWIIQPVGKQ